MRTGLPVTSTVRSSSPMRSRCSRDQGSPLLMYLLKRARLRSALSSFPSPSTKGMVPIISSAGLPYNAATTSLATNKRPWSSCTATPIGNALTNSCNRLALRSASCSLCCNCSVRSRRRRPSAAVSLAKRVASACDTSIEKRRASAMSLRSNPLPPGLRSSIRMPRRLRAATGTYNAECSGARPRRPAPLHSSTPTLEKVATTRPPITLRNKGPAGQREPMVESGSAAIQFSCALRSALSPGSSASIIARSNENTLPTSASYSWRKASSDSRSSSALSILGWQSVTD